MTKFLILREHKEVEISRVITESNLSLAKKGVKLMKNFHLTATELHTKLVVCVSCKVLFGEGMCYRKTFSSRKICYNSHFSLLHVLHKTEKPQKKTFGTRK